MKKNSSYEATFILDIAGKEEGVDEVIAQITKEVNSLGGEIKGTQRMDRKPFERVAGKLQAGYYLGVQLELDPSKLQELEQRFILDPKFFRQFYIKTKPSAKKEAAAA